MDLNTLKSANAATSDFGGADVPRESRMFPVKHGGVPRASKVGGQTVGRTGDGRGAAGDSAIAGRRTKRAPVTFEEVAAAADAIVRQGEKITIERVRQAVGGGGNQAVMDHLARYKELRRKGAQFGAGAPGGLMSEALKAALSLAIDDEIRGQRACAQESMQERLDELQEACGALEADLKIATNAAFEQEEDLEKMAAALSLAHGDLEAARQQSALAREKALGQVETLQRQNRELQATAGQAVEAAVEARVKDAIQVSQIAALQAEVKRLREASDGAISQVAQAEQKAAVAQTQAAGKDELLQVLQQQLSEAQTRSRELAEEGRHSHERARVAEEAQQKLRHKLDAAHGQAIDAKETAEAGREPVSSAQATDDGASSKEKSSRAGFLPPSREPASNPERSATFPPSKTLPSFPRGPQATDEERSIFAMREREIEVLTPLSKPSMPLRGSGLLPQRHAAHGAAGTTAQATRSDSNKPARETT